MSSPARQRLIAAHRLAAGDPPALAEAVACLETGQIAQWRAANDDLDELVRACRTVQRLNEEEWLTRLIAQARLSMELALSDGNSTALMEVSRTMKLVRPSHSMSFELTDETLRGFIDTLSDQERTELASLGYSDLDEFNMPQPEPSGDVAVVLPFRRHNEPSDETT